MQWFGRRSELASLNRLLDDVRGGTSRVLVLRGEAGAGKTALLDHMARHAPPARIVRAAGAEAESGVTYSALQQLCAPLLPHLDRLPEAERSALSVACGLTADFPPELELLATSVLALLGATDGPLVCLIDDVQWLDRLSGLVLAAVARRLDGVPVAMVFATRDQAPAGLPELPIEGLADADARALLDSVLLGPVDPRVRDQIVAETRGNPLALLELPRGLSPAELAFGAGATGPVPAASPAETGFQRRIAALPADSRTLLLVAAVEPSGDARLLWRALDRLGIGPDAAGPADGLIELGDRVLFRHPLVRSAGRHVADPSELRGVHAALADVVDDPDRQAWHRAHAVLGPDEQVAAELERSAVQARARGGLSATAAFLDRAAALTPDPRRRAGRALAAAHAQHDAGSPLQALDLLAVAELGPLSPMQEAEVARLRGQLAFALNTGRQSSAPLMAAAARLEDLDVVAARETYLAAMGVALHLGRLGGAEQLRRAAEAARELPPGEDPAGLFLTALITWTLDGYRPAVPLLVRALSALTVDNDLRLFWLAAMVSMEVYDDAYWHRLTERAVRSARETGALSLLPAALSYRVGALMFAGRFAEARQARDEAIDLGRVTGLAGYLTPAVMLAAHDGREGPALEQIEATERDARDRGTGRLLGVAGYSRAVLYNGLGNYAAALEGARHGAEYPDIIMYAWNLSELVEAATRAGEPAIAAEARDRLAERTSAAGTPWAGGVQALADALAGPETEENFRLAVEQLGRGRLGLLEARARLLYGEWLRRGNRRGDAREQLRAAHAAFASMGAEAFAFRAERELLATGETVHRRAPGEPEALTPQESQIARLAVAGRSNPEIGAELFLSPRTVEWHLRKVFTKLGISSRRELANALRER